MDNYFQQQHSGKVEHKFSDRVSLTGFYLYNRTERAMRGVISNPARAGANRVADPSDSGPRSAGRRSSP